MPRETDLERAPAILAKKKNCVPKDKSKMPEKRVDKLEMKRIRVSATFYSAGSRKPRKISGRRD